MTPHRQPDALLRAARAASGHLTALCRARLSLAGIAFAAMFAVLGLRVLLLAAPGGDGRADVEPVADGEPAGERAAIVDRNGTLLATTLPTSSLYANPNRVRDPARLARRLDPILPERDAATLTRRLEREGEFIWLKRDITPRQHGRIQALGSPALGTREETKRYYPQGKLAGHLVGFTDVDGRGLAGVEKAYGEQLRRRDEPLRLALDVRVQHALSDELRGAVERYDAKGAAGVVMDARTGELVAMTSLPAFDPAAPDAAPETARFNRATQGAYEMGSVFKIFAAAAALESENVRINDRYSVDEPVRLADYTVRDFHPLEGELTVPELFMKSSNIGTVKMARATGAERITRTLKKLGLTRRAPLALDAVADPIMPEPWRRINAMTASYGHGIAVTPVQIARAVAATVNGGVLPQPSVRRDVEGDDGRRVLARPTSRTLRRMMRLVVAYGTGGKAAADGYRVAGKTGTADKASHGGYGGDARVASFAGAFPSDDPRYVIFTLVDEPKASAAPHGYATGGWVAAPVVRKVVERVGPLLGIRPNRGFTVPKQANNPLLRRARQKDVQLATR